MFLTSEVRISRLGVTDARGSLILPSHLQSFFTPPFEDAGTALQDPMEDLLIRNSRPPRTTI